MGIVMYACFAYGMAAVISYLLIGVIVGINHFMNCRLEKKAKGREEK